MSHLQNASSFTAFKGRVSTKSGFGSQFFITLGENLDSLDGEHLVFGQVVEGLDVITKLNQTLTDDHNRPYQDIRISHTVILNDPFPDPDLLEYPDDSPKLTQAMLDSDYIGADESIDDTEGKTMEELQEEIAEREAKARATILEMVGDLPDSDMAPPENVLFVCKLNPVTTSHDLEIIFSRFGKINSCEVICDRVTNNSLQYAFIEFAETKSCEDAYFKMDNVLIDDRRIHVDFSQSISKIKWKGKGKGVEYFDDNGKKIASKKGQTYNPSKESERMGKNRNSNKVRAWGGRDYRSSNGGPRQYYDKDISKSWDRRSQQWNRNGNHDRIYNDNRDRYDKIRGLDQINRDDRHGRRYDGGKRDGRDSQENDRNRNKEKQDAKNNYQVSKHKESGNEKYSERGNERKSEGELKTCKEKYDESLLEKFSSKPNENDATSSDDDEENFVVEGKIVERETNLYRHEPEREKNDRSESQDETSTLEERCKRKFSESEAGNVVPSDEETQEKLLKELKKSLKKKKRGRRNSDSDFGSEVEKKRKKRKKKQKPSSDSTDTDSSLDVRRKSKKSKKKKKKTSSLGLFGLNSKCDSKKKTKKRKKKKKKKDTSDSSD
ncbi:Peptidyl-prolyl cis-trans isomerase-like 4 [Halocaridina rubra]|uniref:Peptidyl-prolyl cis-trans isomerase n=1 Tax=Halocaridina rubra TaxID=373956 RepID=A0AAN8XCY6_HALRR